VSLGYLTIDDVIPKGFLENPTTVVVEAPNGLGKTHCMSNFISMIQKLNHFIRIYMLQYSQKGCENAINKILDLGGKVIWYQGVDKFCPLRKFKKQITRLGLSPTQACLVCPKFQGKHKIAYIWFKETMEDPQVRLIKPEIFRRGYFSKDEVCTQPIIRAFSLEPTFDIQNQIKVNESPVIVCPSQLFINHAVIGKWIEYGRRQRRERPNLIIIDESDTLFYTSLLIKIPEITFSDFDYEIMDVFSTKTRKLRDLVGIYEDLIKKFKDIAKEGGFFGDKDIEFIKSRLEEGRKLVTTARRRRKEIVKYVLNKKRRTNFFLLVSTIEELLHVENFKYSVRSIEFKDGMYLFQDYEFGIRVLLDPTYPWRYFWKVNLTATFPTNKVVESRFLSLRSRYLLSISTRRYKTYENVYVSYFPILGEGDEVINRNEASKYCIPKLLKCIKLAVKTYRVKFRELPKGVCIWGGNSKQYRNVCVGLQGIGLKLRSRGRYSVGALGNLKFFISYVGSSVARGIDLNMYDISIGLGPLLRPPRPSGFLDVVDFGKAIAETVQSVMRVVRSPKPSRPKLVILDKSISKSFYVNFYPEWFKKLFESKYLELQ